MASRLTLIPPSPVPPSRRTPPVTAQSSELRTASQTRPVQHQQRQPHPPPPRPLQHAPQLPPRSQRDPQRGDLLAFLPGRPVVMDACVTHPLAASAGAEAAWTKGGNHGSQRCTQAEQTQPHLHWCLPFCTAESRDKRSRGPRGFVLLNEIAEYSAGIASVSKKLFMENAMRDQSTTLCRGVPGKS